MRFLENIFARLARDANAIVVREVTGGQFTPVTGSQLLSLVAQCRSFISARGLKRADRLAVVAPNSIRWVALDLAAMAEGVIVVPLYARQAAAELAAMMKDATPALIVCSDEGLSAEVRKHWPSCPEIIPIDAFFAGPAASASTAPISENVREKSPEDDSSPVTIIYTSGTSGEAKGVVLNAANINHMLGCTGGRLDQLMTGHRTPESVFHYTPFCFAASWIALLTFLSRNCVLTLSTDLNKLSDEMKLAAPDYFLNVPTLLERVRAKVSESIQKRGGITATIFTVRRAPFLRFRMDKCFLWTALAFFSRAR